jgi:hypothetical protein
MDRLDWILNVVHLLHSTRLPFDDVPSSLSPFTSLLVIFLLGCFWEQ